MSSRVSLRRIPISWQSACLLLPFALLLVGLLAREFPGDRLEAAAKRSALPARFTIADFDGDQKPDLATVKVDQSNGRATSYSIHLQLSVGPESVIGITAPVGGLQIVSRDVNGDRNMDLVVRTSLESNFVAVLLNDGHGKFTMAQAGAFPGLERESEVYAVTVAQQPIERISMLPPRITVSAEAVFARSVRFRSSAEPRDRRDAESFQSYLKNTTVGRSPPQYFHIFS
jgi:hypothetical protein